MKKVYLVYYADRWLDTQTKTLIGVCSTKEKAIEVIKKEIEKEHEPLLTYSEITMLKTQGQTQGREWNYMIEEEAVI